MTRLLLSICLPLLALSISGCEDDVLLCYGGTCESQEQCLVECEEVCIDGEFNTAAFDCVNFECECECFVGCF